MDEDGKSFDEIRDRLNEIADEVAAEGVSIDEALALYEEAVKLGLAACDISEEDIELSGLVDEEAPQDLPAESSAAADAADAGTAAGAASSDDAHEV